MQYYLTLLFLSGIQICLASNSLTDTVATANDYLASAKHYASEGAFDQAIEDYELAKTQFAQKQDDAFLVFVLNHLADLYMSDPSTQEKAEAYLDTANILLDEKLFENDSLRALTWYTMAELKSSQRKFDEAIAYYQKSLIRKKAILHEDHVEIADVLEQIGRVYLYRLRNPFASKPFLEQSLKIRESLDNQDRVYINGFYHLAVASRLRADYEEALAYGFKALNGYENLEEPSFKNIIFAHSLLGSIYLDMDSVEKALDYNTRAIQMARQNQLLESIDMSLHYNNQAVYHFQAKAYDSTIYYAQLAIANYIRSETLASSYQFLGNAYWGKGEMDKAFLNYQKSLELKESLFDEQHSELVTLYIDLGRAFETSGQVDSALYYFKYALKSGMRMEDSVKGVPDIQEGVDLASMPEALNYIVSLLIKQNKQSGDQQYLAEALPYFKLFDRFMDINRKDFSSEGSKLLLSGKHKVTYEQAIATSYQLYQSTQADSLLQWIFHFMEKSKAMVLLESIHQADRYQRALPDSLYEQEQSLRAQLAYFQSELIQVEHNTTDKSDVSYWQLQKADVLRKLETLNHYIQTHYPNFYHVTYKNLALEIDSVQKQIDDDQAIISYFWGDSVVYALLITAESAKVFQVQDVNMLQLAIRQYMDVLTNDSVLEPSYSNYLSFQESSHRLYQLLLEPMLKNISLKRLTIIADGDLTTIPFESFTSTQIHTQEHKIRYEHLPYLIKDYDISYEFSLSVAFWEQQFTPVFTDDHKLRVAAFGIKTFDKIPGHENYPPLGGAERETKYILEKFPNARIFLNTEATEMQFKQQAPEADILHIATHGVANLENPFASKFIFYPEGEEDGIFNLYELYNIPLKAKVLLLSACESGVGKYYKGEGNFSLARSFVYAGSKSVIMSLWQVNDLITEQLIKHIYDRLAEQKTTSESLRETKIAFINERLFAHPQCWAGMVPLGNTSIAYPQQHYEMVLLIAGLVITGIMIILLIRMFIRYKWHIFPVSRLAFSGKDTGKNVKFRKEL
ncbi:CHAT domain-containing protein [Catalinimonas niigatensis]|uniref:CHAT domain-containing protein n=1 Tax=Catalinimonas niigatensis TaxID=1397264 RepID=UPI002666093C|nr:CHAT domain-containing tetratricopeptide repeat protein [Catalinimonas niigatensis]WPP51186.1 CHAT domain-containing tetratricopeptide repeat protein [Catalinimonas niigatensis]